MFYVLQLVLQMEETAYCDDQPNKQLWVRLACYASIVSPTKRLLEITTEY